MQNNFLIKIFFNTIKFFIKKKKNISGIDAVHAYLTVNLLVRFELSNDQVKGSENRFFIFL